MLYVKYVGLYTLYTQKPVTWKSWNKIQMFNECVKNYYCVYFIAFFVWNGFYKQNNTPITLNFKKKSSSPHDLDLTLFNAFSQSVLFLMDTQHCTNYRCPKIQYKKPYDNDEHSADHKKVLKTINGGFFYNSLLQSQLPILV